MNVLLFLQDTAWTAEQMKAEMDAAPWGWTANLLVPVIGFIILVTLITVVMSMLNMFKNPAAMKKSLLGAAILGGLLLITFFMASDKVFPTLVDQFNTSPSTFKWVGAGITTTGVLIVFGLLLLVFDLVKGLFKI